MDILSRLIAIKIEEQSTSNEIGCIDFIINRFGMVDYTSLDLVIINEVLSLLKIENITRGTIAAILTVTASRKNELSNREKFYNNCREYLISMDGEEKTHRLLVGLE